MTQYSSGAIHYRFENGDEYICENDMFHSLLGPAKVFNHGQDKQWWIEGVKLDCTTQEEFEIQKKNILQKNSPNKNI